MNCECVGRSEVQTRGPTQLILQAHRSGWRNYHWSGILASFLSTIRSTQANLLYHPHCRGRFISTLQVFGGHLQYFSAFDLTTGTLRQRHHHLRRNPRFSLNPHSHWRLNTVAFQLGNNEGKGSSPHRPWPPSPAPTGVLAWILIIIYFIAKSEPTFESV